MSEGSEFKPRREADSEWLEKVNKREIVSPKTSFERPERKAGSGVVRGK